MEKYGFWFVLQSMNPVYSFTCHRWCQRSPFHPDWWKFQPTLKGLVVLKGFVQPCKILINPGICKWKFQHLISLEFEHMPWKSPRKLFRFYDQFLLLQQNIFTLIRAQLYFVYPWKLFLVLDFWHSQIVPCDYPG